MTSKPDLPEPDLVTRLAQEIASSLEWGWDDKIDVIRHGEPRTLPDGLVVVPSFPVRVYAYRDTCCEVARDVLRALADDPHMAAPAGVHLDDYRDGWEACLREIKEQADGE